MARSLNFTQEQRDQVRQIIQSQRQQLRQAQVRIREARESLDQAMYSEEFDQSEVEVKIQNLAQAQAQVTMIRLRSEMEIRKILSTDQLRRFLEIKAAAKERRRQRQMLRRERMRNNRERLNRNRPPRQF